MFKNAGAKLMALAKIIFYVSAGLGVLGVLIAAISTGKALNGFVGFLIFLIGAPICVLFAWLSNIALYAFGELCENVMAIRQGMGYTAPEAQPMNLGQMASSFSSSVGNAASSVSNAANNMSQRFANSSRQQRQQRQQQQAPSQWICPNCGKPNGAENAFCTGCGCTRE